MKKTLIASAVAAAALSTSAFAMDPATELAEKLDSMPTIYGNVQIVATYADVKSKTVQGAPERGMSDYGMADNGSTLGFKHSHEVAPGLTAFAKIEFEYSATEKQDANQGGGGGLGETDEAYLGLKGDFGSVWVGTNDTIYETWVEDVTDHYEYFGVVGEAEANFGNKEDRTVEYVTPSMGGFQLGAAYQMNGQGDNQAATKTRDNLIVGAKYSLDALTLALVYGNNEADNTPGAKGAYGFSAAYEMDAFKVGFSYETQEDYWSTASLLGVYTMGANQFALSYAMGEEDGTGRKGEVSTITVQALHNMSDNFYVYTEAQIGESEKISGGDYEASGSQAVLGATYVF
ncbi:porin [Alkalimarinus sediminis]|uniref:Porin n=1 Tax=Alkalimarinus sediminis TaxID=1632866 RepID=A0A9E8HJD1_9ALTE|nr:porin [Alkalimarinus sediminis]UZW75459.1 porin [Alkalimarinus sediminis]